MRFYFGRQRLCIENGEVGYTNAQRSLGSELGRAHNECLAMRGYLDITLEFKVESNVVISKTGAIAQDEEIRARPLSTQAVMMSILFVFANHDTRLYFVSIVLWKLLS